MDHLHWILLLTRTLIGLGALTLDALHPDTTSILAIRWFHGLPSASAESEYRAVANAVAECCWLLGELSCPVNKATVVFCDNVSAVYMASNPVHHKRTKHIELDIHFVRECVQLGEF